MSTQIPMQNIAANQIQYQQPNYGLSPETKGTLASGAMASILGGLWFAQPKIAGADALLTMDKDSFEKAAKNFTNLTGNSTEKNAFNLIKAFREHINKKTDKTLKAIFKNKENISTNELIKILKNKKLKNYEKIDTYIEKLNLRADRMDLSKIIKPEEIKNGLTAEHFKKLDEFIPDNEISKALIKYKNKFKKEFPIGKKITNEELYRFIAKHTHPLEIRKNKLSMIQRILTSANENGVISKTGAQKAIKRHFTDNLLDNAKNCFEILKTKLPKARLKSAAKWFGLGIAASIISNMVVGMFAKKSNK